MRMTDQPTHIVDPAPTRRSRWWIWAIGAVAVLVASCSLIAAVSLLLPAMHRASDLDVLRAKVAAHYPEFVYVRDGGGWEASTEWVSQMRWTFYIRSRTSPNVYFAAPYVTDLPRTEISARGASNLDEVLSAIGEQRTHGAELVAQIASAHASGPVTVQEVQFSSADPEGRLRYYVRYANGPPPSRLGEMFGFLGPDRTHEETYLFDPLNDVWTRSDGLASEVDQEPGSDPIPDEELDPLYPQAATAGDAIAAIESEYPGYDAISAQPWDPDNTGDANWLVLVMSRQVPEFRVVLDVNQDYGLSFAITEQYLKEGSFTRRFERAWVTAHPGTVVWEMNPEDIDAQDLASAAVVVSYFDSPDAVTKQGVLPKKATFEFDAASRTWKERR